MKLLTTALFSLGALAAAAFLPWPANLFAAALLTIAALNCLLCDGPPPPPAHPNLL